MDFEGILNEHNIRVTAMRLLILKGIEAYGAPFSLEELYNFLVTVDRSTVFRALTLFEENRLLNSFEDGSGKRKYCFCHKGNDEEHAHHNHYHATCRVCGRTFCVTTQNTPVVVAPDGFEVENINYIITGVCEGCKKA